jgi:uncharacterized protein (DUF4415 family)
MKRQRKVTKRAQPSRKAGKGKSAPRQKKRLPSLTKELVEMYRPVKKPVTVRLDADILAWFQLGGRGYQTRINQALRKVMMEERGPRSR